MSNRNCPLDIHSLPSPPTVAVALLDLFNNPDAGIDDLIGVIQVDPALCARVISHSNSAAVGLPRIVDSVGRATVCLGMNTVRMIALSFSLTETSDDSGFDFSEFWNRSVAFAVASQAVCKLKKQDADAGFLTGMMMNIGELGLYRVENQEVYNQTREMEMPIEAIIKYEIDNLGTNRFEAAADILNQWGFPKEIPTTLQHISAGADLLEMETCLVMGWNLAKLLTETELSKEAVLEIKSNLLTAMANDEEKLENLFDTTQQSWLGYSTMLGQNNDWQETTIREIEKSARIKMTSISIMHAQEHTKAEQEVEELRATATKDALTGVNNRRAYDKDGLATFRGCQRSNGTVSILVIDIDRFKLFNDTHGHKVGDETLKHVATTMSNTLREYDNLFRYGGEEFAVILPGNDQDTAFKVAERLRKAVANSPVQIGLNSLNVSISVGIATFTDANQGMFETLFENADSSLYKAKKNGRNRCEIFGREVDLATTV